MRSILDGTAVPSYLPPGVPSFKSVARSVTILTTGGGSLPAVVISPTAWNSGQTVPMHTINNAGELTTIPTWAELVTHLPGWTSVPCTSTLSAGQTHRVFGFNLRYSVLGPEPSTIYYQAHAYVHPGGYMVGTFSDFPTSSPTVHPTAMRPADGEYGMMWAPTSELYHQFHEQSGANIIPVAYVRFIPRVATGASIKLELTVHYEAIGPNLSVTDSPVELNEALFAAQTLLSIPVVHYGETEEQEEESS